MKASLRLEAAERPQCQDYFLSRLRSCGHMPSLVGDGGQVLRVLGWALTRIRNLSLVLQYDGGCVWNRAVSCLANKGERWG